MMQLVVDPVGLIRTIYDEQIDLAEFGHAVITRASHLEPDTDGRWRADLSPVGGPLLGPFDRRSQALEAERAWLETHWLVPAG
jgi:hypothetical protein